MSQPNEAHLTQTAVSSNLQYGLGGPRLKATDATHLAARNAADGALVKLSAADGTAASDVATFGQLQAGSVSAFFGADGMVGGGAAASVVPPGSRLLTILSATATPRALTARAGTITSFAVRHVGNVANVAQTVTYTLRKLDAAGVDSLVSTSAAVAAQAGAHHDEQTFAPLAMAIGDSLYVVATPSAGLTATTTDIEAAVGLPMAQPNGSDYGLKGIGSNVQLGKGGPRVKANGAAIEVRDAADGALATLRAADAVAPSDVVTLVQLQAATDGDVRAILINFDFNDFPGSVSSNTVLTGTETILSAKAKVDVPFTAGATASVGSSGSTSALLATTDIDLTKAGISGGDIIVQFTADAIQVTLVGAPVAGSGSVLVTYANPQT